MITGAGSPVDQLVPLRRLLRQWDADSGGRGTGQQLPRQPRILPALLPLDRRGNDDRLAGSQSTNSNALYVGTDGSGTLTVAEGGAVTSSDLYVGDYGRGTLTVADGGHINNYDSYLGDYSGSTGEATITGAGSQWTSTLAFTSAGKAAGR